MLKFEEKNEHCVTAGTQSIWKNVNQEFFKVQYLSLNKK